MIIDWQHGKTHLKVRLTSTCFTATIYHERVGLIAQSAAKDLKTTLVRLSDKASAVSHFMFNQGSAYSGEVGETHHIIDTLYDLLNLHEACEPDLWEEVENGAYRARGERGNNSLRLGWEVTLWAPSEELDGWASLWVVDGVEWHGEGESAKEALYDNGPCPHLCQVALVAWNSKSRP